MPNSRRDRRSCWSPSPSPAGFSTVFHCTGLVFTGSEGEARLVLRLLATLCRRSALLADIDLAALRSLPEGLNATLLIGQRDLSKNVRKFLLASGDRHFHVARGNNNLHTCGAKAISTRGEFDQWSRGTGSPFPNNRSVTSAV